MVYEVPSLDQLDATKVDTLLTQLTTQIQENNSDLDLKRGVVHDIILYYHAILESAVRENLDRYQSARSLQQIEADPTIADTSTVSDVLSNWGITRREGTQAAGEVSIVVSTATSVTISSGAVFEAGGLTFTTDNSYTSTSNASSVTTANDRLMTKLSDGNYLFTIFVTAVDVGTASKLNANTLIVPNGSISNYVTSYVTSGFSGGTDTETNTELINQLQDGISAKALSNRVNMRALLRSLAQFSSVTNQSIVGYSDPEMLRDRHSIFPLSFGGRVDWYIRGQANLSTTTLLKDAVLVSVDASGNGTWQFALLKDDVPGFYEVTRILLSGAEAISTETFAVTSDSRGVDMTDTGFVPDIDTQDEGAFTAYQTATIQFVDTETDASGMTPGDKQKYAIDVTGTPHIKTLQAYMGGRDTRSFGSDVLIKAPVPCFVQVSMTLNKSSGDADPDVDAIKTAVASVVNGTTFIGRLDGSRILEVVSGYIQNNISVTDLDLLGRIFTPQYTSKWVRDGDSLVISDDANNMVTAKTVQFFTDVSDISVNIQTTIPTFS